MELFLLKLLSKLELIFFFFFLSLQLCTCFWYTGSQRIMPLSEKTCLFSQSCLSSLTYLPMNLWSISICLQQDVIFSCPKHSKVLLWLHRISFFTSSLPFLFEEAFKAKLYTYIDNQNDRGIIGKLINNMFFSLGIGQNKLNIQKFYRWLIKICQKGKNRDSIKYRDFSKPRNNA